MKHVVITMETESFTWVAAASTVAGAKRALMKKWNDRQKERKAIYGDSYLDFIVKRFSDLEDCYGINVYEFNGDGCQVE